MLIPEIVHIFRAMPGLRAHATGRPVCNIFIGSIVTELTTQESRRIDTFVTHWLAALSVK